MREHSTCSHASGPTFEITKFHQLLVTSLRSLTPSEAASLRSDIQEAKRLASAAVNSLLITPSNVPKSRTASILFGVFGVGRGTDPQLWSKVGPIKDVYNSVSPRLGRVTFFVDKSPAKPGLMDNDAGVPGYDPHFPETTSNAIWLRQAYFRLSRRDRALTLIHEHVHLVRPSPGDGHPGLEGRKPAFFSANNFDIPYEKAIRNPYCYQYYADWIDDPSVTGAEF